MGDCKFNANVCIIIGNIIIITNVIIITIIIIVVIVILDLPGKTWAENPD